jgi:hypothetical protein
MKVEYSFAVVDQGAGRVRFRGCSYPFQVQIKRKITIKSLEGARWRRGKELRFTTFLSRPCSSRKEKGSSRCEIRLGGSSGSGLN